MDKYGGHRPLILTMTTAFIIIATLISLVLFILVLPEPNSYDAYIFTPLLSCLIVVQCIASFVKLILCALLLYRPSRAVRKGIIGLSFYEIVGLIGVLLFASLIPDPHVVIYSVDWLTVITLITKATILYSLVIVCPALLLLHRSVTEIFL